VNEGAKTGIYWIVALAMLFVAFFITQAPEAEEESIIGQPLFPGFSDPLAASVMRIVTFNEEQGELAKFEVAKDEQTGVWSLPSRNNYPADASEQMKNAANALVGVKVLDIQSENPEDHSSLGVLEPNADSLQAGDEGVGRLVTLKGQSNTTLASLIIGKPVKGSEEKRYVRIPAQDPVYVVALDDKPLSTKFEDWIEKDLLQLSSIDINDVEIKNYDASVELGNQLILEKHYDAKLSIDGSNAWQLDSLVVYDDQGEAKDVTLTEGEKLATSKLNTLKNALDDLKIVDVAAKPKGMSENLKADKELVSDQQAVLSLLNRGFFAVSQGDILSANGQMTVTLKDGVQYILRFGNVKGIDDSKPQEDGEEGQDAENKDTPAGANRYLLVTTQVDESKFPPPELANIPKTIEELDAMNAEKAKAANPEPAVTEAPAESADAPAENADAPAENADAPDSAEQPAKEMKLDAPAAEEPATEKADGEPALEGVTEQTGEAAATGSGQGQDKDKDKAEATDETPKEAAAAEAEKSPAPETTVAEPAAKDMAKPTGDEETAEEKQERLEAEQEKITKENQRKLDERKDKLEAARRAVRELNGRFAEWYYVIPEATYRNLRLSRDELIEKPAAETSAAPSDGSDPSLAPSFSIPGLGQ
jgi:hypothetical protein